MLWGHWGARRGTGDTCCGVMDERARGTSACFALLFVVLVASSCFLLLLELLVAFCCFLLIPIASCCCWDSWYFFLGQAGRAYDTWRGVMGERAAGHGSAQEAVLRKFGAYEPLELCYQASKPWGRFFIFDTDFVAYNRAGMRAEDPAAHKWSASKLWIDYTPFVKRLDWMEALKERIIRDDQNLRQLLREHKKEQST